MHLLLLLSRKSSLPPCSQPVNLAPYFPEPHHIQTEPPPLFPDNTAVLPPSRAPPPHSAYLALGTVHSPRAGTWAALPPEGDGRTPTLKECEAEEGPRSHRLLHRGLTSMYSSSSRTRCLLVAALASPAARFRREPDATGSNTSRAEALGVSIPIPGPSRQAQARHRVGRRAGPIPCAGASNSWPMGERV